MRLVRRMTCAFMMIWATFGLVVSTTSAQDDAPRFRSGVQLVQLFVVVRDRHAKVVEDLTAEDFEVRDQNRIAPVSTFAHVRVPSEAGATTLTAPEATQGGVRAFTILYDDLHCSPQRAVAARRVAERLITRWMRPADLVAVRNVSDQGEFTLLPVSTRDVREQVAHLSGGVARQPLHEQAKVTRVSQLMRVLAAVARATGNTPERRAVIVLISEGVDYDIFNLARSGSADVVRATETAISTLRQSNVVLYTIDPRGLASSEGAVIESGGATGAVAEANRGLGNERASLRHLAEETGGFAAINGNDLSRAADRVGDELSGYYLLGFAPSSDDCDNSFRRIRVKVRRPHLRVTARAGYVCGGVQPR